MDSPRDKRLVRLREQAVSWIGDADYLPRAAMIEVAFLMAMADQQVSQAEFDQLVETVAQVTTRRASEARVREIVANLAGHLKGDGWERRLREVAARLPTPASRRTAYRLAAGVSFVDGAVQQQEADLFGLLAEHLEIPRDEAGEILRAVRADILGGFEGPTEPVLLLVPRPRGGG